MIEDTPDKIRRNLVTFSALIIAAWVFDLRISDSINVFGAATIANPSGTKFWLTTSLVLIYLALRYHFDSAADSGRIALIVEHRRFQDILIVPVLRRLVHDWLNGVKPSAHAPIVSGAESFQEELMSKLQGEPAEVGIALQERRRDFWGSGDVYIHVSTDRGAVLTVSRECSFEHRKHVMPVMIFWPLVRTLVFSKSSVDVLIPYMLFFAAVAICGLKLYAN